MSLEAGGGCRRQATEQGEAGAAGEHGGGDGGRQSRLRTRRCCGRPGVARDKTLEARMTTAACANANPQPEATPWSVTVATVGTGSAAERRPSSLTARVRHQSHGPAADAPPAHAPPRSAGLSPPSCARAGPTLHQRLVSVDGVRAGALEADLGSPVAAYRGVRTGDGRRRGKGRWA